MRDITHLVPPSQRYTSFAPSLASERMFDHKPPNLHPQAERIWDWYARHLRNAEIYPIGCAPQFAQLCMYEAFLAKHDMLQMPLSITTDNGAYPNPDLLMYDKIMERAQKLWSKLALNPIYLWQAPPSINGAPQPPSSRIMLYMPDNGRSTSAPTIHELPHEMPQSNAPPDPPSEEQDDEDYDDEDEPDEDEPPAESQPPPGTEPLIEDEPPPRSAPAVPISPDGQKLVNLSRWKALAG